MKKVIQSHRGDKWFCFVVEANGLRLDMPANVFCFTKSLLALIFCPICPIFTRGMQNGELFGLLGNRPDSHSTKLVIKSEADATFANLFPMMTYISTQYKTSSDILQSLRYFALQAPVIPSIFVSLLPVSSSLLPLLVPPLFALT